MEVFLARRGAVGVGPVALPPSRAVPKIVREGAIMPDGKALEDAARERYDEPPARGRDEGLQWRMRTMG